MWISDYYFWIFECGEGEGVDVLLRCFCGSVGSLFLEEFFWNIFSLV